MHNKMMHNVCKLLSQISELFLCDNNVDTKYGTYSKLNKKKRNDVVKSVSWLHMLGNKHKKGELIQWGENRRKQLKYGILKIICLNK